MMTLQNESSPPTTTMTVEVTDSSKRELSSCLYKVKLERVLGVTVNNNAALASHSGTIAYPAGCTIVLLNSESGTQSHLNASKRTITSLAFSPFGDYLLTGECGHQPAVRVWDLATNKQVAEMTGHKFGIACVAFSPTNKLVVSVGSQHDMVVNVWDWKSGVKIASNKVSTKVKSVAFSENGKYFVTVGNRHVKFWYLDCGKNKYNVEAVPLMGRSAILGDQRNNNFVDVACGQADCAESTYAITRSGLLCEFNNRRLLDKWVELRTPSANSVSIGSRFIFVGCADGIVRCFDPKSLVFVTTLPRPHYLGVDVAMGLSITHISSPPPNVRYPDTVAVTYDEQHGTIACVYNDHSVYIWDVHNVRQVGKTHSFLYHSACIWGLEMARNDTDLPLGSFLTCSSDDTIRVWTLDKLNERSRKGMYQGNIYSRELAKVLYVDKELAYLKDATCANDEKADVAATYDGRNGVRAIRISPDGRQLASGDRIGNIRIHDLATMREHLSIEAHDSEVLCLDFTRPTATNAHRFLASASRDRLIHVFDVDQDYKLLQTLEDHSSSITALRFLDSSSEMVSCGADKSLIFRSVAETVGHHQKPQFTLKHNVAGKTTLYDMEVDQGEKHVLTACQDRNVRIYSVANGKHTKTFKGSVADNGTLIKLCLDPSGTYLATSCTDKSLSMYDYYTGECMATMCGHSELVTGLRFTNDCRKLISVSGDGCIFVWTVPHDMTVTMQARLSQQALRNGAKYPLAATPTDEGNGDNDEQHNNEFRFSIGQLPKWAKRQLTDDCSPSRPEQQRNIVLPKGRWAERAEGYDSMLGMYQSSESPHNSLLSYLLQNRLPGDGGEDVDGETTPVPQTPLYYPTVDQTTGGTDDFTVVNIDADELRKSVRRSKQQRTHAHPSSVSNGSQDSDESDEASTPSGENTDRNPLSIFSVSSESLDRIAASTSHDKYLQSTFESLSRAETDNESPNKSSISAQYHTRNSSNGTTTISTTCLSKNKVEATKRREELNRIVAKTKLKLQELGYKSMSRLPTTADDADHHDYVIRRPGNKCSDHSPLLTPSTNTTTANENQLNCNNNNCCPLAGARTSSSLPDLQVCGCRTTTLRRESTTATTNNANYLPQQIPDIISRPSAKLSDILSLRSYDRTCAKQKTHKSLPASPVGERAHYLSATQMAPLNSRRSFSYFLDLDSKASFKQICDDIEKFSQDFTRNYQDIEDIFNKSSTLPKDPEETGVFVNSGQGFLKKSQSDFEHLTRLNFDDEEFSSDSLEDCSLKSAQCRKHSLVEPRRCVSNNEIYKFQDGGAVDGYHQSGNGSSFFLNSQESLLSSDDNYLDRPSYCNSMESILSNDSECKSAPLDVVFVQNAAVHRSKSLYDYHHHQHQERPRMKTTETQTDFEELQHWAAKKKKKPISEEFQRKLLKFEARASSVIGAQAKTSTIGAHAKTSVIVNNNAKSSSTAASNNDMDIPSLDSKNKQYRSKFCNVLNNKPEALNCAEKSGQSRPAFVLTKRNPPKNKNLETNSLDRHLLLRDAEKIYHKPPKAVRHSNKNQRKKHFRTFEYIKKDDFQNNVENMAPDGVRQTIEFKYAEKSVDGDVECSNHGNSKSGKKEIEGGDDANMAENMATVQKAVENLEILNEIQAKLKHVNNLVDFCRETLTNGKVKALSCMYDALSKSSSDVCHATLYHHVTEDLDSVSCEGSRKDFARKKVVNTDDDDETSSLRRVCSLSDLTDQNTPLAPKNSSSRRPTDFPSTIRAARPKGRSLGYDMHSSSFATRSRSVNVLNHSDSEDNEPPRSRLMQPTISSKNKAVGGATAAGGSVLAGGGLIKPPSVRKRFSKSSTNLSYLGRDDSSSEELERPPTVTMATPTVPPRTRIMKNNENSMNIGGQVPGSATELRNVAQLVADTANKVSALYNGRELMATNQNKESLALYLQSSNQLLEDIMSQLNGKSANFGAKN